MTPDYCLYINGEFRKTSRSTEIINPATSEVIAQAAIASEADIEDAIAAARAAYDAGPWREMSLKERARCLKAIARGILDKAAELAQLETFNAGKPVKESTFMDIPSSAKSFEYFADNLEDYLRGSSFDVQSAAQCDLVREPHGVAVLIVPWNYPLLIATWKMSCALAAGNTVILKPSSLTPLTALELATIVHAAGLPAGVVNVVNAKGASVGEKLCADRRVDMISFTGSNEVGRDILGYASRHVKKLIMELGGKSASIVLKDADLELAVNGSLCSIFLNQGQMCTAMSRILVEDDVYDSFVRDFISRTRRIKLGDGRDFETQMGPLISAAQRDRVLAAVKQAQSEGAKIACGGRFPDDEKLNKGFFFEPTVLTDVTPGMRIFREEVFGPVACISKFSDEAEAIGLANQSDYALAASIWSGNPAQAARVAGAINAGIVWINTYGMFYNEVPYGGFKESGFGKELGREGFLEYCRLKSVVTDTTIDAKPLVNYWYGF